MKLDRRTLSLSLAALLPGGLHALRPLALGAQPERVTLGDIDGLTVGHRTRDERPTGCTVVLAPAGATGGVAIRGAAPGTRETALLDPAASVDVVHGIVLSGGSAFGLATADGGMRWLRERGHGFPTSGGVVPIVPAAILYDLGLGSEPTPDGDDGYRACEAATSTPVVSGSVGAGAGATIGKMFGGGAMRGGIGSAGYRFDDGTLVAALIVVNCRGDVRDPASGRLVAGARTPDGAGLRDTERTLLAGNAATEAEIGANTTIGVVATNRTLDKAQCSRLAAIAHDGLARAIVPAHTRWDGDTLFALATNALPAPDETRVHDLLDVAAAAAVTAAILDAVDAASSLDGLPSARDLGTL